MGRSFCHLLPICIEMCISTEDSKTMKQIINLKQTKWNLK